MMSETLDLSNQNKMIISLLGRLVFPESRLKEIITKHGKKQKQMISAYNLCNGDLTTQQIANKVVGITARALNTATLKWEEAGIIIISGERGKGKDFRPLHLYKLGDE